MRAVYGTKKSEEGQEKKEAAARWRGDDFAKGSDAEEEQCFKNESKSEAEADPDPHDDRGRKGSECGYVASASSAGDIDSGKGKYREYVDEKLKEAEERSAEELGDADVSLGSERSAPTLTNADDGSIRGGKAHIDT